MIYFCLKKDQMLQLMKQYDCCCVCLTPVAELQTQQGRCCIILKGKEENCEYHLRDRLQTIHSPIIANVSSGLLNSPLFSLVSPLVIITSECKDTCKKESWNKRLVCGQLECCSVPSVFPVTDTTAVLQNSDTLHAASKNTKSQHNS